MNFSIYFIIVFFLFLLKLQFKEIIFCINAIFFITEIFNNNMSHWAVYIPCVCTNKYKYLQSP